MTSYEESLMYRQMLQRDTLLSCVHEDLQVELKKLEWPFYRDDYSMNLNNIIFFAHWYQDANKCWFWYGVQSAIEMFQTKDVQEKT